MAPHTGKERNSIWLSLWVLPQVGQTWGQSEHPVGIMDATRLSSSLPDFHGTNVTSTPGPRI